MFLRDSQEQTLGNLSHRLTFLRKFFLTQFSISARKLVSERKAFQGIVVRIDNALYVIFNHYLLSLISLRIDLYIFILKPSRSQ